MFKYTSSEDGQIIVSDTRRLDLQGLARWTEEGDEDATYAYPTMQSDAGVPVAGLPGHEITGGPTHLYSETAGMFPPEFINSTEAAEAYSAWQAAHPGKTKGSLALKGEVRSNIDIADDKSEDPREVYGFDHNPTGTAVNTDSGKPVNDLEHAKETGTAAVTGEDKNALSEEEIALRDSTATPSHVNEPDQTGGSAQVEKPVDDDDDDDDEDDDESEDEVDPDRPSGNASTADWLAYANEKRSLALADDSKRADIVAAVDAADEKAKADEADQK